MSQLLQYLDEPLVPGQPYQLSFNTDITSGVLIVKQGTQVLYTSEMLTFGAIGNVNEMVRVSERIYLDRASRVFLFESTSIVDIISLDLICSPGVNEDITVTESFSASII